MRILMIAPEPFFEPRGTPFSEYHRIRALTTLGHTVDLVTYPFGQDVELAGLRVFRCGRPPFVRGVRVGPSWPKAFLDLALFLTAARRAVSGRYDMVHSHEEGAAIGLPVAWALRLPHLYDMHSSLPQQLDNFAFSRSRTLKAFFSWLERAFVRHSRAVIVICPHLGETVRRIDPAADPMLIENAPGSGDAPVAGTGAAVRAQYGLAPEAPLAVYTGTLEAYQGIDLLFEAMAIVARHRPEARLLLAGGKPAQVERARAQARSAGIEGATVFAGERPAEEIPSFLDAADLLVSPRSTGTNTPLKIYQYLRSGRPIVATRLLTHTQVLDDEVSILTEPTPEGLAGGILEAFGDPCRGRALGARARGLAERKYSDEAYIDRTRRALEAFGPAPAMGAPAGSVS
jgi:glycosyltransferase involved in cell wall biosynthesis